ncbi:helix-turn-helix domain-containing protein [Citrobacter amalonaticus]
MMERTTLARSTVMDILHQLRKGNYILMDRGYLFFINKLPDKF